MSKTVVYMNALGQFANLREVPSHGGTKVVLEWVPLESATVLPRGRVVPRKYPWNILEELDKALVIPAVETRTVTLLKEKNDVPL